MDQAKRRRLEKAGWKFGDAEDFLRLTEEEAVLVEMRLALSDLLRELRLKRGWTQSALAGRIGSSQSRVAKMEAGVSAVSIDLMMKALLEAGATPKEIGRVISRVR